MKNVFLIISVVLGLGVSLLAQDIGGVKGRIRSLQGGTIADVKISISQNDKEIKTAITDKKGEFQINGLKVGKYDFTFTKPGFVQGMLPNVEIKKNKIRDLGDKLALDIDQGTLVIIEGSVFYADGRSIYGATIDIARVENDGSARRLKTVTSSEAGQFTFRFKEGGKATYRITASAKGKSASKDITVDMAAVYRLALTLDLKPERNTDQ